MIFYQYRNLSAVITSGTYSDNILKTIGVLKQIYIKPTSTSTIYDVQLIDRDNDIIFERNAEQGILNELTDLPLQGIYTIKILNSTVDENFIIKLFIKEI